MAMSARRFFQRPRRWRATVVLSALAAIAAAWLFGLAAFADNIPRVPPPDGRRTEAIVVLTGGSGRMNVGLELLAAKQARKLLVSGVYRGVDVAELLRVSKQSPADVECCIALGYTADSTRGNAAETAAWMRENGFRSLRLVTANYHMQRSLLEFQAAMPGLEIVPHPVIPDHVKLDHWWQWPGTASLIVTEYCKFLLAWLTIALPPMPATS
ncbi:MAG: YdcF family protein [Acetobacterales bacterium]